MIYFLCEITKKTTLVLKISGGTYVVIQTLQKIIENDAMIKKFF